MEESTIKSLEERLQDIQNFIEEAHIHFPNLSRMHFHTINMIVICHTSLFKLDNFHM